MSEIVADAKSATQTSPQFLLKDFLTAFRKTSYRLTKRFLTSSLVLSVVYLFYSSPPVSKSLFLLPATAILFFSSRNAAVFTDVPSRCSNFVPWQLITIFATAQKKNPSQRPVELLYIDEISLAMDIKIIIATIRKIFDKKGISTGLEKSILLPMDINQNG